MKKEVKGSSSKKQPADPKLEMKSDIRERFLIAFEWIIKNHPSKITSAELSDAIGSRSTNISRVKEKNDTNFVEAHWIAFMATGYNINADWIVTGRGDMLDVPDLDKRVATLEHKLSLLAMK